MVRGARFRAALIGAMLAAGPAGADQTDPRLPELFARLAAAEDGATARILEQRIWAIWTETDDPESTALLEQGSVAMANRNWPEAQRAFDALVAQAPGFAEGWNKRATLYWLMGDHAASVRDIRRTLALEPRHFGALSGLGLIFMAADRPEAAIAAFEAALRVHPFLPGARDRIELLRRRRGGEPL